MNNLIERLREESLYRDKCTLEIMDLCMEAAENLERLQTENVNLIAANKAVPWIIGSLETSWSRPRRRGMQRSKICAT